MNRIVIFAAILIGISIVSSCVNDGKSDKGGVEATGLTADPTVISPGGKLGSKVGSWVEKGIECYGIVVVNFADGRTIGKAVKCKVMAVKTDKIKMKTIESVSLMESEGCDKLGLGYGDTWWETEGDLFKTRTEAENYLHEKGWFIK